MFYLGSYILGAIGGSFANACVYRWNNSISIFDGRSKCTACGKTLTPSELIPIVSFILQRGKCKHCLASIGTKYLLIELLAAFIFTLTAVTSSTFVQFIVHASICLALLVAAASDALYGEIPDQVHIWLFAFALGSSLSKFDAGTFIWLLVSSVIVFVLLLLLGVTTNSIGGGDIKLFSALSLYTGIEGFILIITAASVIALFDFALRKFCKLNQPRQIRFAPYILAAFVILTLLYTPDIYMALNLRFLLFGIY